MPGRSAPRSISHSAGRRRRATATAKPVRPRLTSSLSGSRSTSTIRAGSRRPRSTPPRSAGGRSGRLVHREYHGSMTDPRRIALGYELHSDAQLPDGIFMDLALERGLREIRADGWASAAPTLDGLEQPILRFKTEHHESAVLERDGLLVHLTLGPAHVQLTAAGERGEVLDELFADLHERFPPPDPTSRNEVPVTFWTYGPQGPQPAWRSIAVPG